ncbi:M48 family metallopeptidase [Pelagerythrobacter rhizovicinus]|uniref:PDZ domain-containing protein n=1 Tax=Pelagerythrobacter rhizovicinus TaxID=2268576 RepID=A0A4Q2KHL7_9SPHN|nr:M48 family metallopeptidase [Pelagerythrobacter rhizovicinus]RXZ64624.1 PDZ domain-containing protein [Pelagerythrobacter rhizovicinus]
MIRAAPALALLLALAQPALAESREEAAAAALAALQQSDARLLAIGWRLAAGNAAYCSDARPAVGLLLQDMAGYAEPEEMRKAAGIAGPIAVQAVAPGSPAEAAGLRPNDEIAAIDGMAVAALPAADEEDWRRLARLHDAIESSLAADGRVLVTLLGRGDVTLEGVPACPSRFEIIGGDGAAAEGTRVVIGRKFVGLSYPEDEFAAAIAHEFAHNLLRHRAWLDVHGRRWRNVRVTEREADRMMPWLLANAGYDPGAALRFMRRWGPRHGGGLFRKRTHEGWDERAEMIEMEIARVQEVRNPNGSADWARHFRREIAEE